MKKTSEVKRERRIFHLKKLQFEEYLEGPRKCNLFSKENKLWEQFIIFSTRGIILEA